MRILAFDLSKLDVCPGLCETNNMNKAGYTPVMLAALTAADSPDDLEVAQQLLKLGNVNACSRQVTQITESPDLGFCEENFISGLKSQTLIGCRTSSVFILFHLPSSHFILIRATSHSLFRRRARQRSCSQ